MPTSANDSRARPQAREKDPKPPAPSTESVFDALKKAAQAGREDRGYPRPR